MSLVVVGVNERDTSLGLLGTLAISDQELAKVLKRLSDSPNVDEAVVLSTCMRIEIYAVVERFHDGISEINALLEERGGSVWRRSPSPAEHVLVEYDDTAARHLFEVAAGMDSAVLGEGEILRQVRHAAARSKEESTCGPVLDALFRHAIEVGKRVRTETGISRGITSLAHVTTAVAARASGGSLAGKRVVVVGAGEMGEGIADALCSSSSTRAEELPDSIVIANRSSLRAERLAERVRGRAVTLAQLPEEVAAADVIMTATSREELILDRSEVQAALLGRPDRPLVIVDAALPRDVDPEVRDLEGVTLFDLEDLRCVAEQEVRARQGQLAPAGQIIEEEMERYRFNSRSRSVVPVIASLREQVRDMVAHELAQSQLDQFGERERQAIERLTYRLAQKFLHEPTVQLKEAAGSGRGERLAEALRTLFNL